jgi:hypothetical protein
VNRGQTEAQVKFLSRGNGYALFLTGNEAVLSLARNQKPKSRTVKNAGTDFAFNQGAFPGFGPFFEPPPELKTSALPIRQDQILESGATTVVRMKLLGANRKTKVAGMEELPGKVNYFIGNDPKKWRTNVATFARVKYENVYPGVDLVYYGNQGGQLEYDFVVAPGSDPKAITLDVDAGLSRQRSDGAKPLRIDANGDLVVATDGSEVRFHKPAVYQLAANGIPTTAVANRQLLDGNYVLTADNHVHFEIPSYDKSESLVIDPVLSYSTYLGGSATDAGIGVAVDSSGNAYVTGTTESSNFPTLNPIQSANAGSADVFVAKLNSAGNALVYSTYLGGSGLDQGNGIAVDSSGNAYVTGVTMNSPDFPTVSPLPQACGVLNLQEVFAAKLNPAGSALVYSTCIGGGTGLGIAVDSSGNAYLTGDAGPGFPTINAFQPTFGGQPSDAFVAKLNAAGNALLYSTYLGGTGDDRGNAIAVDSAGNAYVTGSTTSIDFPTANPFQSANHGGLAAWDAYVAKLSAAGNALVYSTYLGGTNDDFGYGIAVDSSGSAYVTGWTTSTDFPTASPLQAANAGAQDAFVSKLNAAGSALVYSTYLGGNGDDRGSGIALDSSGNAYVTGAGGTNFPTVNPLEATPAGIFVTEVNAAGSALVYSTYLGGTTGQSVNGIAVDSSGDAYVTGNVTSNDFPTLNAVQPLIGGGNDGFLAKISPANAAAVSLGPAAVDFSKQAVNTTSPTNRVMLRDVGSAALTISNIFITGTNSSDFALTGNTCGTGLGGGAACGLGVAFTPTTLGPETAAITVTDSASGSPHTAALSGTGVVRVSVLPANLTFAAQPVGTTSATQQVTLTNNLSSGLTITGLTITGTNSADFAKNSSSCGGFLSGKTSCTINVWFMPTATGARAATLTVTYNDATSPQTVALSGTATPAAPLVTLNTTSASFGGVFVGMSSATLILTVTNSGSASLSVSTVSITGSNASDFTKQSDSCSGASVAPASTCTISLVFKPSVSGTESATLSIADNASDSPQAVSLSGTGEDFGVAVSSGSSSSATITAGQNATYTITVSPQGGFNQAIGLSCSGAPTASTCMPSRTSVTLDGTNSQNDTVTVTTTARGMLPPTTRLPNSPWSPIELLLLACVAALMIAFGFTSTRRLRPQAGFALLVLCVISLAGFVACGGGSSGPPPTGTPAGTYTLTITGTSGSVSHKTTLTLTVN